MYGKDSLMALNDYVQLSELGSSDVLANGPGTATSDVDTGNLRRRYNFGDRVSELAIAQDPFFRFLNKVSKKPTDDPSFKFTEKRGSYHKRYAYVTGWVENDGVEVVGGTGGDADLVAYNDGGAPGAMAVGDTIKLFMSADYKSAGNIQNVYGQSNGAIAVGASGTEPTFFLPGQLVKVPMSTTDGGGAAVDYLIVKVTAVTTDLTKDSRETVQLDTVLVRDCVNTSAIYLAGWASDDVDTQVYDESIHSSLEGSRCYIVGSAHDEGSGYPETWKDQPYSTQYGYTQIWKTAMAMTNTARATQLKYEGNEWARIWKEKLIEHKWDLETSLLFGSQQTTTTQTTQGAVDYIANYGNVFSLDTATKTSDDFLDDMSNYMDPRYNSQSANVFFCNTAVYNWLHKLGGYFKNNLEVSSNFRSDIAMTGKKKVFGVDISTFSTPYGDMNVARNIHLDGTNVKLLGIDMKHCAYRPLVGNGVNRDTSIYVGVQTLENSGVDRRVDLILTEAGMEWSMPESHAMWT